MYRCRGEEEDTFQGNIGKLGVYRGIVNLKARGGRDQGEIKVYVRWAVTRRFMINKKRGDVRRKGGM